MSHQRQFDMLCERCLQCISFCGQLRPYEKRIAHHDDIESLQGSVRSKCPFCTKLWTYMSRMLSREGVDFEQVYSGNNMTRGSAADAPAGSLILMLVIQWTRIEIHQIIGTRFDPPMFSLAPCEIGSHETTCLNVPVNVSMLPRNKSVGESWTRIQAWVRTCQNEHKNCQLAEPLRQKPFMPTRLVRIDGDSPIFNVILTSREPPKDHSYIALSYCWGQDEIMKLESRTLNTLYDNCSQEILPRTYQDVMTIARQLGIYHIWIDALCIQQDDPRDWLRESSVMHEIYGSAMLTVTATSGVAASSGLYQQDTSLTTKPLLLTTDLGNGNQTYLLDWLNPAISLVSKSPVSKRGWIYQERLLSRRILHFADEQLFWECNELSANETFPEGFPSFMHHQMRSDNVKGFSTPWPTDSSTAIHTSQLSHQPQSSPSSIWNQVISEYTSRKLTNESDKLPALSGLASRFKQRFSPTDQYLAGLWRSHLPLQLLWQANNATPPTQPKHYQAPSWSPFSLIGRIISNPPKSEEVITLIHILTASTTGTSTNETGSVTNGSISLQCLGLISLTKPDPTELSDDMDFLDSPPLLFASQPVVPSYDLTLDTTDSWTDDAETFYLPVTRSRRRNEDVEDFMFGFEVQGLVLRAVGEREGLYKRVGLLKVYGEAADLVLGEIGVDGVGASDEDGNVGGYNSIGGDKGNSIDRKAMHVASNESKRTIWLI